MNLNTEVKSLASLVTFRQLYDDGKRDIYYIVSKFAESVIVTSKLYCFGVTEMAEEIRTQFGFRIPDYVIQSSLKRLACISKRDNKFYVDYSKIDNNSIGEQCEDAGTKNEQLVQSLYKFAEEKKGQLTEKNKEILVKDFCAFVLDESNGNGFSDVISAFIIENQNNQNIMGLINTIKEGAVLYAGINYNSNVSEKSAWNMPITVYVEIEILFHLAGYNGEVFKRHADDLFALISEMNSKSKQSSIKIKYFDEVKSEIDKFFTKAENIVNGNDIVSVDNYAMNTIVNGCKSASDVIEKKAAFFRLLKAKGIIPAGEYDYYCEENYRYNLESPESIEKYELTEDKIRYLRHINYVNILRQDNDCEDLKNAQHIVLTEVGKMLHISSDVGARKVPLVINMSMLTNRLWFDLNKGFGASDFPSNFNVLLKSKIVLSSMISQSVSDKYEKAYCDYKNKKIDTDQMADIILSLREETKKPEDINTEMVDDILGFISEKELNVYQSEKERLDNAVKQREQEIEEYKKILNRQEENLAMHATKEKDLIRERNEMIEKVQSEMVRRYDDVMKIKERADFVITKKTKRFVNIIKFLVLLYYIVIIAIFVVLDDNAKNYLVGALAVFPPLIGCIITLCVNKKMGLLEGINLLTKQYKDFVGKRTYQMFGLNLNEIEIMKSEIDGYTEGR